MRTTAHGIAAATGKVGAFIFPLMLASSAFRLPGAMGIAGAICVVGLALTFLLPEPARKSLETIEKEGEKIDAVTGQPDSSETTEFVGQES